MAKRWGPGPGMCRNVLPFPAGQENREREPGKAASGGAVARATAARPTTHLAVFSWRAPQSLVVARSSATVFLRAEGSEDFFPVGPRRSRSVRSSAIGATLVSGFLFNAPAGWRPF